jgi:hypothetical protein
VIDGSGARDLMSILIDTDTIDHIPVLTLAPQSARRCPVVFFIPGFGSRKEFGLSLGYAVGHTLTPDMERDAADWLGRLSTR